MTNRAMRMCTWDTVSDELTFLRTLFLQNGYPERFVDKTMERREKQDKMTLAEKKTVFISLPFKGDTIAETITRRLNTAINRTFYAANLRVCFNSAPALCLRLKDKVPASATSFCVYSFTCSCGTSYVGRTTRRLSERIREHHPAWINNGVTKTITSAIVAHLVDTNHTVNLASSFRLIYRVKGIHSKAVRCRILATAEAIGIRLNNPPLCAQKRFVQALKLPWPNIHTTTDQNAMVPVTS
ncbi:hypothetical protein P879_06762 [Paragonimus westermani]|uniref:Helix-turn-helix domain-containing protein n=1 Tax=Paragonimus westermani TaxID=34504 RepID=A0A8T0DD89_9TREM|nr:hypothetical protein P879_06762 [Paragonimus westermani]